MFPLLKGTSLPPLQCEVWHCHSIIRMLPIIQAKTFYITEECLSHTFLPVNSPVSIYNSQLPRKPMPVLNITEPPPKGIVGEMLQCKELSWTSPHTDIRLIFNRDSSVEYTTQLHCCPFPLGLRKPQSGNPNAPLWEKTGDCTPDSHFNLGKFLRLVDSLTFL